MHLQGVAHTCLKP